MNVNMNENIGIVGAALRRLFGSFVWASVR
jgi:hypothetical protein